MSGPIRFTEIVLNGHTTQKPWSEVFPSEDAMFKHWLIAQFDKPHPNRKFKQFSIEPGEKEWTLMVEFEDPLLVFWLGTLDRDIPELPRWDSEPHWQAHRIWSESFRAGQR